MPGTNYTHVLDELTEAHSEARGRMARSMRDVDENELNAARANDAEIRQRVQAISDGRAYGSGCDHDPRGYRPLVVEAPQQHVRSGPKDYDPLESGENKYQHVEDHYQTASDTSGTGNLATPSWADDTTLPAYDHSQRGRKR